MSAWISASSLPGTPCADGARRGAETPAGSARKIRAIPKAAGVGNIAERLTCLHQRVAFDQVRRMIQTKRRYVLTVCRPADREQLLQITQRNSRLGSHLARREVRIGKAVLDDSARAHEQLVVVAGAKRGGRCKQGAEEIINHQTHKIIGRRARRFCIADRVKSELTEQTCRLRLPPTARATLRLEAEMRRQVLGGPL